MNYENYESLDKNESKERNYNQGSNERIDRLSKNESLDGFERNNSLGK